MRPPTETIAAAIRAEEGNLRGVARRLKTSPPTLYKWIWQAGLQKLAGLEGVNRKHAVNAKHGEQSGCGLTQDGTVNPAAPLRPSFTIVETASAESAEDMDLRGPRSVSMLESLWRWARIEGIKTGRSASDVVEELVRQAKDKAERTESAGATEPAR